MRRARVSKWTGWNGLKVGSCWTWWPANSLMIQQRPSAKTRRAARKCSMGSCICSGLNRLEAEQRWDECCCLMSIYILLSTKATRLISTTCAALNKMSVIPTDLSNTLQSLNESMESKSLAMTGFATDWFRLRDVTARHRYGCVPPGAAQSLCLMLDPISSAVKMLNRAQDDPPIGVTLRPCTSVYGFRKLCQNSWAVMNAS